MNQRRLVLIIALFISFSIPIIWGLLRKESSAVSQFSRQFKDLSISYSHHFEVDFEPFEIDVFKNRIFLLDIRGDGLVEYDLGGHFIRRIGSNGQGPGEFQHIVGWSIDEQGFEIIDSGNLTVTKLNSKGKFLRNYKIDSAFMQGDCFSKDRYVLCMQKSNKERELVLFYANDSSYTTINNTLLEGKNGMSYAGFLNTNNNGIGVLSGYLHGFITCFDDSGKVIYNKSTIDNTPPPKILSASGSFGGSTGMISYPDPKAPVIIHSSTLNKEKLFLVSGIKSANEREDNAAIDVYKLKTGEYLYSFYIPKFLGEPVKTFAFTPTINQLIAYQGESLVFYDLDGGF